jgi:hypothetical protein
MTTTAQPVIAGHAVITPDLSNPKVGQPTVVAFFQPDHTVLLTLAFVTGIGPVDEITGHPTLSVVFPRQPADGRVLGSVRWSDAFDRVTGVQHYSHPDAQDGKLAIAWGGDGDIEIGDAPQIPQPEGNASNPIYDRHELNEQPSTSAVTAESLIAQRGQAPEGAHLSPLTSEAGEVHDATVAPKPTDDGIPGPGAAEAVPAAAVTGEQAAPPAPETPGVTWGTPGAAAQEAVDPAGQTPAGD